MSLRALFLLLTAFLSAAPLLASTYTWLGTKNDRTSDPANWIGGSPAGDAEATLIFPPDAERFEVTNDIPGLSFKALSIEIPFYVSSPRYVLSGEPMRARDATISTFNGGRIGCPLQIEGTLTVSTDTYGQLAVVLEGPISGSGGVLLAGGRTYMTGRASNTYSGATVLRGAELTLSKERGAIAIAGEIRAEPSPSATNRLTIQKPEQIADSAAVRWPDGAGFISLRADETIGTLETGTTSVYNSVESLQTLTVSNLILHGRLYVGTNLVLRQGILEVPAEGSLAVETTSNVSVPDEGITLRGPGRVQWHGDYTVPTRIDGAVTVLHVASSDVIMTGGAFGGGAKSIVATGGTLEAPVTSETDIRLAPAVRVTVADATIRLDGVLDLGGASLVPRMSFLPPLWTFISNLSSEPLVGMFGGIEENGILDNRFRLSYRGGSGNDVTLTELEKPLARLELTQSPRPGFVGEPVALEMTVTGSAGVPTGTLTIDPRRPGEVPMVVPLAGGRAAFSLTFNELPIRDFYVSYSGDSVYAGFRSPYPLVVQLMYRTPILNSVKPASAPAGKPVMVTLRGLHFRSDMQIHGVPVRDVVFVSSSEIQATFDLTNLDPSTLPITVSGPGGVSSYPFDIKVTVAEGPPGILSFDERGAIAHVSPGAQTAWMRSVSYPKTSMSWGIDQDHNGVDRWIELPPATALWSVVDLSTGNFGVRGNNGVQGTLLPFAPYTFLRDGQGNASRIQLPLGESRAYSWNMLWVRPGVGAWRQTLSTTNADGRFNWIVDDSIDSMTPLGGTVPHPAGFAPGDVVLLLPDREVSGPSVPYFAAELTADHFQEAPGVLQMGGRGWEYEEDDGPARVRVLRLNGAAGSASVRYTTVDAGAQHGVHFQETSGTLTFGPGETVQWIEIPLIDDRVYRGTTRFHVVLSDASGATLAPESNVFVVSLLDNDPRPVVSVDGDVVRTIAELDVPQVVTIALRLTGATSVPITISWRTSTALPVMRGQVTFAPGETRRSFSVVVPGNDRLDPFQAITIYVYLEPYGVVEQQYVTIVLRDDETPYVTANDVVVDERAGTAHVTLSTATPSTQPFFVAYSTINSSATAPSDFLATSGTVSFDAGQTQATIAIPIVDDVVVEGDKAFELGLQSHGGFTRFERATIPVVIVDDDLSGRPTVSIDDVQFSEPADGGGTAVTFTVRLSAPSKRVVAVNYRTLDGSAAGGLDYRPAVAAVYFAPGATVKTDTITIFGDRMPESPETFLVKLGSALNATIADDIGVITIVDDDSDGRRRAARK